MQTKYRTRRECFSIAVLTDLSSWDHCEFPNASKYFACHAHSEPSLKAA
jgi:hypothetical protein